MTGALDSAPAPMMTGGTKVKLGEFVIYLRDRLIVTMTGFVVAFVICFSFAELVIRVVPAPVAGRLLHDPVRPFFSADPIAHDSIRMRVAIFGAICLSFLFLGMQEWLARTHRKKASAHE
jgi:Sec-independent protein secretion pathway component TatC